MDELDIDRAVILGASSGGFPARSFAIRYPKRTSGLILLGTPSSFINKPSIQSLWDSTISKLSDPIDPKFVRNFSKNLIFSKIHSHFLEIMLKENLKVPARVWKSVIENIMNEEFPGKINEIEASTLIIWGENDDIVTRDDINSINKAISKSKLLIYKNAGHLFYWEEPELVSKDILEFIKSIS